LSLYLVLKVIRRSNLSHRAFNRVVSSAKNRLTGQNNCYFCQPQRKNISWSLASRYPTTETYRIQSYTFYIRRTFKQFLSSPVHILRKIVIKFKNNLHFNPQVHENPLRCPVKFLRGASVKNRCHKPSIKISQHAQILPRLV
jgi:hypothetical protein